MVMYSVIIFSVSGLNTLFVRVRVVSLSGLCPVRVVYLSGLCPCPGCVCPVCVLSRLRPVRVVSCPGYAPVRVVSVRVVSVRVASCPGYGILLSVPLLVVDATRMRVLLVTLMIDVNATLTHDVIPIYDSHYYSQTQKLN